MVTWAAHPILQLALLSYILTIKYRILEHFSITEYRQASLFFVLFVYNCVLFYSTDVL